MGVTVTVKEVKVWDKTFAAKAKAAAESGGAAGAKKGKVEGDFEVELKCSVELEGKTLKASCGWLIKQGSKLFPNLAQSKKASASKDVRPDKISAGDVDDVASSAAQTELEGIVKKLAEWEASEKKKR
jgi:hypothetical protein